MNGRIGIRHWRSSPLASADTALGGAAAAVIAAGIAVTPVLVEANFDDMKMLLEGTARDSGISNADHRGPAGCPVRKLGWLALFALTMGSALAAQRPVVVELFTSLACSDCPPADALLQRVRAQQDVLALDLHVTYWNDASWTDPYSLPGADELQNEYAALRGQSQVYTPEAIVDGQQPFVGSDSRAMAGAIEQARARIAAAGAVSVTVRDGAGEVGVVIGSGQGAGTAWLFGFDPIRVTAVRGGENAGATISEVNVVRSITRLGDWHGGRTALHMRPPAGTRFAVVLRSIDGKILGAATS